MNKVRRARPLLGTLVDIRIEGLDDEAAHAAIERGFAAVADIHRLMSFHEASSDISRLNREGALGAVAVDGRTYEVLHRALDFSQRSGGVFDVTTAYRLVAWGFLPTPDGAPEPDPDATWRDIILEPDHRVRFRRPLWIDLGGIAKGYAVDQGLSAMALPATLQVCVNAGGDLRIAGPAAEPIRLRTTLTDKTVPVVELAEGALASSSGHEDVKPSPDGAVGPHVDGRDGASVGVNRFVSVAAETCLEADALTKVVLAMGRRAEPILCDFGAIAYFYDPGAGWVTLGTK